MSSFEEVSCFLYFGITITNDNNEGAKITSRLTKESKYVGAMINGTVRV